MGRFVLRRLLQAIPTFFGITLVSFVALRLAPGDPVLFLVGGTQNMSPGDLAAVRAAYGRDQPLPIQYLTWLGHLLTGDFGRSFQYRRPVIEMIQVALPNTILLSGLALTVTLLVGVPLGLLAARYRGGWIDRVIRVVGVSGHAVTEFWF